MADSTSRWEPPKPKSKFSWIEDPADRFRGKGGKARITGGDTKAMLDYDKSLYTPLDRGGGQAFRVNGQPERFAGTPAPTAPAEAPLPTTNAGILARYSTPQPGRATVRPTGVPGTPSPVVNPLVTTTDNPATPVGAGIVTSTDNPANPALEPAPVATNPALGYSSATGEAGPHVMQPGEIPFSNIKNDIGETGDTVTGDITQRAGAQPVAGVAATTLHGTDPSFGQPLTGEETANRHPITGEPIQDRTPEQKAAEDKRLFMAQGGSEASYHRAQVAAGIRPAIDARTRQSSLNSTASADIQRGWEEKRKQMINARANLHSVLGN